MTGAPMPDRRRRGRHGRGDRTRRRRRAGAAGGERRRSRARPPAATSRPAQSVFPAGTVLAPAHLGVLASLDAPKRSSSYPRARVGVLSTGDELVERARSRPGRSATRTARCCSRWWRTPVPRRSTRHRTPTTRSASPRRCTDAVAECDAVLTSGGVSVGDYDYVKAALDRLGVLEWWQVAIKPAKPLAFGVVDGTPVFGLPGNPVSSHRELRAVRPAGAAPDAWGTRRRFRPEVVGRRRRTTCAASPTASSTSTACGSATRTARYHVARTGAQQSNVLSATAAANGLALLPDGDGRRRGRRGHVMLLDAACDH